MITGAVTTRSSPARATTPSTRPGSDFLPLAQGNDTGIGGSGDDLIIGGFGTDTLLGGTGNDGLFGGQNSDLINGDQVTTSWSATSLTLRPTTGCHPPSTQLPTSTPASALAGPTRPSPANAPSPSSKPSTVGTVLARLPDLVAGP